MDIQFIDITTYRGVSSNAEHFYAIVGKPSYTQENMLFQTSCEANTGVSFVNEQELRYYPSHDEAKGLYLKDNYNLRDKELTKSDADRILEMIKNGTIRFPSVVSIVRQAKQEFPESILCFSISGSRKEFASWMKRNEKKAIEIAEIVGVV